MLLRLKMEKVDGQLLYKSDGCVYNDHCLVTMSNGSVVQECPLHTNIYRGSTKIGDQCNKDRCAQGIKNRLLAK